MEFIKTDNKMKIGIIGLGDIAQKACLPLITRRRDLELVLCTRDSLTLGKLSGEYGIGNTVVRNLDRIICLEDEKEQRVEHGGWKSMI